MKYKNNFMLALLAMLISLLVVSGVFAQQSGIEPEKIERVGLSGWQFLKINLDARQSAMGGAYTAISHGTVGSIFGNPAAMSDVKSGDVMFTNVQYVADINYYAAAAAYNVEGIGVFGFSVSSLDMGDIPETINSEISGESRTEAVVTGRMFTGGDMAAGISYAKQITAQLSVGANVRWIREEIDNLDMNNISVDFGTIFYTGWRTLRIAMVARNFGPDQNLAGWDEGVQIEPVDVRMPMDFHLGLGMDFFDGDNSPHLLTVVLEASHPNDGPEKVNTGAEYWFKDIIALRAGYRMNYDEESFTFGAGLKYGFGSVAGKVDYAFVDFGLLEQVHMFSLGLMF
jgi:hypothetical protein